MKRGEGRPDWVMLGVPHPLDQGVAIWASRTLQHAEIEIAVEEIESFDCWRTYAPGRRGATLTAVSDDLIVVHGATYAEALARLLGAWQPPTARAAAELPEARPTLPAAGP